MADPSIAPAAIGLLGVLVGAAISTGANWILAVRKERYEARLAKSAHDKRLKRAARLVGHELEMTAAHLMNAIDRKAWRPLTFAIVSWESERDVIAESVPDDDWRAIAAAVLGLRSVQETDAVRRCVPNGAEVDDAAVESFVLILEMIKKGGLALITHEQLEVLRPSLKGR